MGREIKRVPLDFSAPLNEVWEGYVLPRPPQCPDCTDDTGYGSGEMLELSFLHKIIGTFLCYGYYEHGQYVSAPDSKRWHDFIGELSGVPVSEGFFGGVSSSHGWAISKRLVELGGIGSWEGWKCPTCEGNGHLEADWYDRPENQSVEPPTGEGYQMWETVSEGSPITPVFDTPEGLAGFLSHPSNPGWGAQHGPMEYDDALAWITGPGWAPSLVVSDGVLKNGVQAMADTEINKHSANRGETEE